MGQNLTFFVFRDIIFLENVREKKKMNNDNENSQLGFLDILSLLAFKMQVENIENSKKHMAIIEKKLDEILRRLDKE